MLSERVTEWTKQWKQEGLKQGIERGKKEGKKEGSFETNQNNARKMLEEGLAVDLISRVTSLSTEEVKALRDSPSH